MPSSGDLVRTARLKPELQLAKAVSEFKALLSMEQKLEFDNAVNQGKGPSTKDVMILTAELSGGSRCFGPRLLKFLHAVRQFASLGDVVLGGSQNLAACGVWALVRLGLMAAVNYADYFEKVSYMLMQIGRSAPVYETMAEIYPSSPRLQGFVSEYFTLVVQLCIEVFKFIRKKPAKRLWTAMSEPQLDRFRADLESIGGNIENEMKTQIALGLQEESSRHSAFRARFSLSKDKSEERRKLRTRRKLLDFCSKFDYETPWKQTRKLGNASFFKERAEYTDWRHQVGPRQFHVEGKLGAGKSVLMANIVHDLVSYHATQKNPNEVLVAYFFCKSDLPESLRVRILVGSIIRQLLESVRDFGDVVHDVFIKGHDVDDVLSLYDKVGTKDREVFLILDGLDEMVDREWNQIWEALDALQASCRLSICLSSRLEPGSMRRPRWKSFATLSMPEDNPDISWYIWSELKFAIDSSALSIGDDQLAIDIQEALEQKAQGMFLWVSLQLKTLCSMSTDNEIRDALLHLPRTLPETFAAILKASGAGKAGYQSAVLHLLLAARRPLTTEELREAASVVPGDTEYKPGGVINNAHLVLATCGSLIAVDEEESTARFIHHSVRQYLLRHHRGQDMRSISEQSANRFMAETIVTYLSYGIFDKQISTTTVPVIETKNMPQSIVNSVLPPAMHLLLRRPGSQGFDAGRVLAERKRWKRVTTLHVFHEYATANCLHHVEQAHHFQTAVSRHLIKLLDANIWGQQDIFPLLALVIQKDNVTLAKILLSSYRAEVCLQGEDAKPLLKHAAGKSSEAMIRVLLKVNAFSCLELDLLSLARQGYFALAHVAVNDDTQLLNQQDEDGWTALDLAAEQGDVDAVTFLLSLRPDPSFNSQVICRAWSYALHNRHVRIIRLFLRYYKGVTTTETKFFLQELRNCVLAQEFELAVLLLEYPGTTTSDLRDFVENEASMLFYIIEHGLAQSLKNWLILCPDHLNSKSREGSTPVHRICELRKMEMLRIMAYYPKTNFNMFDKDDCTPLSRAVIEGSHVLVESLLKSGKVNVNKQNSTGKTALVYAVLYQPPLIHLLLAHGADPDTPVFKTGRTPLMTAILVGEPRSATPLINGTADLDLKDAKGYTALQYMDARIRDHAQENTTGRFIELREQMRQRLGLSGLDTSATKPRADPMSDEPVLEILDT